MNNKLYDLFLDNTILPSHQKVAEHVPIEYVLVFIKALFNEYHNDINMKVSIMVSDGNECCIGGEEL